MLIPPYQDPTKTGLLGATPPPVPAGTQLAQLPAIPRGQIQDLYELQAQKSAKEDVYKEWGKQFQAISTGGAAAESQLPGLKLAMETLLDERKSQGLFHPITGFWRRVQAADLPFVPAFMRDATAAASNELFDKLRNGALLTNMKTTLQGLGQVRVAEIQMLSRAFGGAELSPAAAKAVTKMVYNATKNASDISGLASAYTKGWRWKEDGTPYRPEGAYKGPDSGFDEVRRQYLKNHPMTEGVNFYDEKGNPLIKAWDPNKAGKVEKDMLAELEKLGVNIDRTTIEDLKPKVKEEAVKPTDTDRIKLLEERLKQLDTKPPVQQ